MNILYEHKQQKLGCPHWLFPPPLLIFSTFVSVFLCVLCRMEDHSNGLLHALITVNKSV